MGQKLKDLNIELAQRIESITEHLQEGLKILFQGFYRANPKYLEEVEKKTGNIKSLTEEVQKMVADDPSYKAEEIAAAASIMSHYQKINFDLQKLNSSVSSKNKEGILFTEKAVTELEEIFRGVGNLLTHLNDILLTRNAVLVDHVLNEKKKYKQLSRQFALEHQDRLIKGLCLPRSSSLYLTILESLEDILWHLQAIVEEIKD